MRALAGLATLAALGLWLPARADHVTPPVVEIRAGAFRPDSVHANVSETVTWVARESGHTVTADDGTFNYPATGTLSNGQTVQHTFNREETVPYHCAVHPSMRGRVVVGAGSPTPTPLPTPTPTPAEQRFVPTQYPTIQAAVAGAPRGTIVNVAEGVYTGSVVVDTPDLTIRGIGNVVIEGGGALGTGISTTFDGLRVQNLTVQNFRGNGVYWEDVRGFYAEGVRSLNNQPYGIYAHRSSRGRITSSYATGSGDAGFYVGDSLDADVVIENVLAEGNKLGYSGTNSGGVVIRNSVFRDNASGVVPNTNVIQPDAPQRGTHILNNLIQDNNRRDIPSAGFSEVLDYPAGIGVWIAGGWFDVVEGNTITGHDRYGVLVSWLTTPTYGNRIVNNVVGAALRKADLAWDGIGANVCFSGNRLSPDGGEPTSSPPGAQTLYSCDLPAQAGVPNPLPDADILLYATRHYWCHTVSEEACRLVE